MYLAKGMRNRKISNNTTAWMMPATGVLPPLLILVMVRAMAPVAGIPPKRGEAMFATIEVGLIIACLLFMKRMSETTDVKAITEEIDLNQDAEFSTGNLDHLIIPQRRY